MIALSDFNIENGGSKSILHSTMREVAAVWLHGAVALACVIIL